ncbi:MAG: hypothetical protein GQ574_22940 [Crocinitomix sp.]|nr:hypothetical protein [Crocinitomix sp.]
MQIYYFNIIDKRKIKNLLRFSLVLPCLWFIIGCNAIFEKDITAETPSMILPTNNDTVYSNKVHFKWNEMEGASFYNLQIVKPSFLDINEFVLDSNINGEEFYQILPPGDYQFKLRGENGGYVSQFAGPYSIYIDSVSDLSAQFVSLVSPADNVYNNGTSNITVSWQNLFAADSYDFILKIGSDFASGSVLDQQIGINTLSHGITADQFDVEGTYFWGIKGVNVTGSSPYTYRQINVDLTAPNDPVLISPADEIVHSIDDPITLKWSTGIDPGSVNSLVVSAVEISTTPTFIDYVEFDNITTDSLVYTFPSIGDYYWRVKADDEAGNFSEFYSAQYLIIVE